VRQKFTKSSDPNKHYKEKCNERLSRPRQGHAFRHGRARRPAGDQPIARLRGSNAGLVDAILDEAASFTGEVLAPLNWVGDQEGCKLTPQGVTTATGWKEAYKQFCESGKMITGDGPAP
jgi:hypothetical protein